MLISYISKSNIVHVSDQDWFDACVIGCRFGPLDRSYNGGGTDIAVVILLCVDHPCSVPRQQFALTYNLAVAHNLVIPRRREALHGAVPPWEDYLRKL